MSLVAQELHEPLALPIHLVLVERQILVVELDPRLLGSGEKVVFGRVLLLQLDSLCPRQRSPAVGLTQ